MRGEKDSRRGFSLIEAMLVMMIIGIAFFAFGFLFGNITQEAVKADLTVVATKLAREKMEEIVQQKADAGYTAVVSEAPQTVTSGGWSFTRSVVVTPVNPNTSSFDEIGSDTYGYKKVVVSVSWGAGSGESVALTTLVTDMVPSAVTGPGYPACP